MTLVARKPRDLFRREETTTETGIHRPRWDFDAITIQPAGFYNNSRPPYAEAIDNLDALRELPEGWDRYDAVAPNPDAIEQAHLWIRAMYGDLEAMGGIWHNPYVAVDEDGDVVFEWQRNNRKLVVYVSPQAVEYLKIEGPAVTSDIADGTIQTPNDYRALWRWLTA